MASRQRVRDGAAEERRAVIQWLNGQRRGVMQVKPDPQSEVASENSWRGKKESVGVVIVSENEQTHGVLLREFRRCFGDAVKVTATVSPNQALRAVVHSRPDLVIVDNHFPKMRMDYWDVMEPILKLVPDCKAMVLAQKEYHGHRLPTHPVYFGGSPVLMKEDVTKGSSLADAVRRACAFEPVSLPSPA